MKNGSGDSPARTLCMQTFSPEFCPEIKGPPPAPQGRAAGRRGGGGAKGGRFLFYSRLVEDHSRWVEVFLRLVEDYSRLG